MNYLDLGKHLIPIDILSFVPIYWGVVMVVVGLVVPVLEWERVVVMMEVIIRMGMCQGIKKGRQSTELTFQIYP